MNSTYFTNPAYPSPYNGSTSCTLTVHRAASLFKICQIRLDFVDFEINRPVAGNCDSDRLVVSGQNSNSIVPPLCGRNSGSHGKSSLFACKSGVNLTCCKHLPFNHVIIVLATMSNVQCPWPDFVSFVENSRLE